MKTAWRPLGYALLAGSVGACLVWLGPPGADLAAHVYQRAFFLREGFSLWNNYWYAGRYSFVTYSLLYYPLAAIVGINLLATASVAAGAGAFGLIVEREWGRVARWAAWAFAVALAMSVLSGAFPYVLGVAFALVALAALQSRRFKTFGGFVAATFCVSPLAFVLLLVILAAALARSRRMRMKAVIPVGVIGVLAGVLWRLFPGGGRFPFSLAELAAALLFCAAGIVFSWRVERARLLLYLFVVYAAFCLLCYLIPSEIGANIVRLRYVAVPIMALTLSLRRWRPLLPGLAVIVLALAWNITPLAYSYARGSGDPSSQQSFWAPAIGFLRSHASPSYRVEVVDTVGHWEADYLPAAGIPLVRGWFRQDDFPGNALLYHPRLARAAYVRWLRQMAVKFVVLTTAPVDYSSQSEALLLRSGGSRLPVIFRSSAVTIFAVPDPQPIVTGPDRPHVIVLGDSSIVVGLRRPGTYRLALRYTPYWSAPGACVASTTDGMISLRARRGGRIRLTFAVTATDALSALLGTSDACSKAGAVTASSRPAARR